MHLVAPAALVVVTLSMAVSGVRGAAATPGSLVRREGMASEMVAAELARSQRVHDRLHAPVDETKPGTADPGKPLSLGECRQKCLAIKV